MRNIWYIIKYSTYYSGLSDFLKKNAIYTLEENMIMLSNTHKGSLDSTRLRNRRTRRYIKKLIGAYKNIETWNNYI